ncbi:dynamin GTPase [Aspergillus sclerotialis]|uniref:Dynamin GTPase n=1 Tax=Aspergillus sclerotialis TaxID=2070753 RepID=A0A3A2ZWU7_9EURO|nr:dynamin GTPase [Aspergillus sclerotialis]
MKISLCQARLSILGPPRTILKDQRGYLLNVSGNFERITSQALGGVYVDTFFTGGTFPESNLRRLRTAIRVLGDCFADAMDWKGHRQITKSRTPASAKTLKVLSLFQEIPNSMVVSYADLKAKVDKSLGHYERLPGGTALALIGELFRNQSSPWENIAKRYLLIAWRWVRVFVQGLLTYLTDKRTCQMLMETVLDPALAKMKDASMSKIQELNLYRQRYPAA